MVPDEAGRFGREVAARLQSLLGNDLIGAYFVGSIALGDYVIGESDIHIVAVSEDRVLDELKPSVADALLDAARDCPTRGLDSRRREVVASPPERADFEVNVNGEPRMPSTVHCSRPKNRRSGTSSTERSRTDAGSRSAVLRPGTSSLTHLDGRCSTRCSRPCGGIESTRRERCIQFSTPAERGASPPRAFLHGCHRSGPDAVVNTSFTSAGPTGSLTPAARGVRWLGST